MDAHYRFAINIPRRKIDEAAAWISDRHELLALHDDPDVEEGATIVHTDRGASALYFLDGGGNVAEFIANDLLETDSDQPFGADSLLGVAEIGIATVDTDATRQARRCSKRSQRRSSGADGQVGCSLRLATTSASSSLLPAPGAAPVVICAT